MLEAVVYGAFVGACEGWRWQARTYGLSPGVSLLDLLPAAVPYKARYVCCMAVCTMAADCFCKAICNQAGRRLAPRQPGLSPPAVRTWPRIWLPPDQPQQPTSHLSVHTQPALLPHPCIQLASKHCAYFFLDKSHPGRLKCGNGQGWQQMRVMRQPPG